MSNTPTKSAPLKAGGGSLFIQQTVGKTAVYVGCLDLDPIVEPAGDQTLQNCRSQDGVVRAIGAGFAPPGAVTTGLKAWTFPESDILDRLGQCDFAVYALGDNCGRLGIFGNYKRGSIIQRARITSRQEENIVMREGDDATLRTLAISGFNPVYRFRSLQTSRLAVAETGPLNAVAFCNALQCAGACGPYVPLGTKGFMAGDTSAGSPATRADIWSTVDAGATITSLTGGAAHPFAAGEDVMAVGCVDIDKTTTRWIVARASVGGEPLKIAYSDDGGATWTLVSVGATNNEGCAGAKALFAFDREHLWLATTAGNVYFSSDGGATWTVQSGAVSADGGKQLNVIRFSDYDNGWAGGQTSALMQTFDGGLSWNAVTPPVAMNVTALEAFTKDRVIIGGDADELYETWDGFVSDIEAKTYSGKGTTGKVVALSFVNEHQGFMIHNTAAGAGTIFKTNDGGDIWEALKPVTNAGLNDIVAIDENKAYAVGNAQGGTAVVLKVTG